MSYDMRHKQDLVNLRTHADVMMLAPNYNPTSGDLPYVYGRVVSVFHVYARYSGPNATPDMHKLQRVNMLWVRWFQLVENPSKSRFHYRCQPRLQFMDTHDVETIVFDFVDPHMVLRAAYILPVFHFSCRHYNRVSGAQHDCWTLW